MEKQETFVRVTLNRSNYTYNSWYRIIDITNMNDINDFIQECNLIASVPASRAIPRSNIEIRDNLNFKWDEKDDHKFLNALKFLAKDAAFFLTVFLKG